MSLRHSSMQTRVPFVVCLCNCCHQLGRFRVAHKGAHTGVKALFCGNVCGAQQRRGRGEERERRGEERRGNRERRSRWRELRRKKMDAKPIKMTKWKRNEYTQAQPHTCNRCVEGYKMGFFPCDHVCLILLEISRKSPRVLVCSWKQPSAPHWSHSCHQL